MFPSLFGGSQHNNTNPVTNSNTTSTVNPRSVVPSSSLEDPSCSHSHSNSNSRRKSRRKIHPVVASPQPQQQQQQYYYHDDYYSIKSYGDPPKDNSSQPQQPQQGRGRWVPTDRGIVFVATTTRNPEIERRRRQQQLDGIKYDNDDDHHHHHQVLQQQQQQDYYPAHGCDKEERNDPPPPKTTETSAAAAAAYATWLSQPWASLSLSDDAAHIALVSQSVWEYHQVAAQIGFVYEEAEMTMDDLYLARLCGPCGGTCWLLQKAVVLKQAYAHYHHLPFPQAPHDYNYFAWCCWPGPETSWRALYRDLQQRQAAAAGEEGKGVEVGQSNLSSTSTLTSSRMNQGTSFLSCQKNDNDHILPEEETHQDNYNNNHNQNENDDDDDDGAMDVSTTARTSNQHAYMSTLSTTTTCTMTMERS
ncbi:hypothetical protein ACA910_013919 [Epithemia clementina (nom. ined.)]